MQRSGRRQASPDDGGGSGSSSDEDMNEETTKSGVEELKGLMREMMNKQDHLDTKVTDLISQLASLNKTVAEHGESLTNAHAEIDDIKADMKNLQAEQQNMKKQFSEGSEGAPQRMKDLKQLSDQVQNLERKSRERNLRLVGYKEQEGEDCSRIIEQLLLVHMRMDPQTVEVAHRTGRRITGKPRHIIFRVNSVQKKINILKIQREALKDQHYFITDDLTKNDLETKKRLHPIIQEARNKGQKWMFKNGHLYVNGAIHMENSGQARGHGDQAETRPRAQYTLPPRQHNKVITVNPPPPRRHRSLPQPPTHLPPWDSPLPPPWGSSLPPPLPPPRQRPQQQGSWARQDNWTRQDLGQEDLGIGYMPDSQETFRGRDERYDADSGQSRME